MKQGRNKKPQRINFWLIEIENIYQENRMITVFYGMNYIVLKPRKQTVDDTKRNDHKHNKVGSQHTSLSCLEQVDKSGNRGDVNHIFIYLLSSSALRLF